MTQVQPEDCILYGTTLVCAICERPYGEDHRRGCDRSDDAAWREMLTQEARDLWYRLEDRNWAENEANEAYRTSRLAVLASLAKARWFRRTGRINEYRAELRSARSIQIAASRRAGRHGEGREEQRWRPRPC